MTARKVVINTKLTKLWKVTRKEISFLRLEYLNDIQRYNEVVAIVVGYFNQKERDISQYNEKFNVKDYKRELKEIISSQR